MSTLIPVLQQAIEISRERFKTYCGFASEVSAEFVENKYGPLAPWTSIILISGPDYRLTFKVHFPLKEGLNLVGGKVEELSGPQGPALRAKAFDFLKEFCNFYGGSLKRAFADAGVALGISLPIMTRGFDQVFFPKADNKNTFDAFWELKSEKATVVCSLFVEALNTNQLMQLNIKLDSSAEGEIDFL